MIKVRIVISTYAELIVYSVFLFPFPDRRKSFRAFPFTNLNYQINFARLLSVRAIPQSEEISLNRSSTMQF